MRALEWAAWLALWGWVHVAAVLAVATLVSWLCTAWWRGRRR